MMTDSMRPTDEIEPMVPVLPRPIRTDGGTPGPRRAERPDPDAEGAPLVPDLS